MKISGITTLLKKYKYPLALIVITLFATLFTRFYIKQGLSGDEPHYLLMAQSLKNDHELNLKNNYEQRTYDIFYKDQLEPHINWSFFSKDSNTWYSIHGPGLAMLVMPSMYIGNRFGPLIVMILISLLAALQVYSLGNGLVGKRAGFTAALVMVGSISFLALSGYIFPDILLGLLIATSFSLLLKLIISDRNRDRILLGLLTGIMIWIHVKTLLIVATLLCIGVMLVLFSVGSYSVKLKKLLSLVLPFLVIYGLFTLKIHEWYGIYLPTQMYKGNGQMLQLSPLQSIPAMFFDGFKGLFVLNPAFLLIFTGLPIWYKQSKKQVLLLLAIVVPSFIIQSTFNDWGGGWSPPARYLMIYVPLLMVSVAFVYRAALQDRIIRWVALVLVGLQLVLAGLYVASRTMWGAIGTESVFYTTIKDNLGLPIAYLRATFDTNAVANNQGMAITIGMVVIIAGLYFIGYRYVVSEGKESL